MNEWGQELLKLYGEMQDCPPDEQAQRSAAYSAALDQSAHQHSGNLKVDFDCARLRIDVQVRKFWLQRCRIETQRQLPTVD